MVKMSAGAIFTGYWNCTDHKMKQMRRDSEEYCQKNIFMD